MSKAGDIRSQSTLVLGSLRGVLRIIVCDPIFVRDEEALRKSEHVIPEADDRSNSVIYRLRKLAAAGDPRLHLINGRFSDLAVALPDLVGESDRERHIARTKLLRENIGDSK